jgi:DNA-binding transcriptional ArsR family regulator
MRLRFLIILILFALIVVIYYTLKNKDYKEILYPNNDKALSEIPVDSKSINLVTDNLNYIISICKFFDISPKSVIGIVIAEHSLNNSPANYFEELYVKKYYLNKDTVYLKHLAEATIKGNAKKKLKGESQTEFDYRLKNGLIWTIGFCQISIIKAWSIEPDLSILENRKKRNIKEVIESLLSNKENIKYCACELSKIAKTYKNNTGKDISNDYLLLTTLYNTGLVDKYLDSTSLKLNRFSNYIALHAELIDEIEKTTHNK